MQGQLVDLSHLRRPHLLMEAARFALRMTRDAEDAVMPPDNVVTPLLEAEAAMDAARRAGSADYSPQSHIRLLTKLLGLARRDGANI